MKKGFTLIELMIVMTIISILAAMVLYGLGQAQKSARDTQRVQIMKGIQNALQAYYGDNGVYPAMYPPDAANSFCYMMNANGPTDKGIVTKGYFSDPIDPKTNSTLCNGGTFGRGNYGGGAEYFYLPTNHYLGNTIAVPDSCAAKGTPGHPLGYMLALFKESGGYAIFCSPQ